jgi:DNA polymerase V
MKIVDRIYEEGKLYKKAGVMLSGLVQDTSVQGDFFIPHKENNNRMLMSMMDNINFSMRDDVLKFAASGTKRNWKMRQEFRSPRYTSRWDELCEAN